MREPQRLLHPVILVLAMQALLLPRSAQAHQRLPATLRIEPAADGFTVDLVVPVVSGSPLKVDVPTPRGCTSSPGEELNRDLQRRQVRSTWTCGDGALWGRALEARGLGPAGIDLLVLADLGDGVERHALLEDERPRWTLPAPPPSARAWFLSGLRLGLTHPLALLGLALLLRRGTTRQRLARTVAYGFGFLLGAWTLPVLSWTATTAGLLPPLVLMALAVEGLGNRAPSTAAVVTRAAVIGALLAFSCGNLPQAAIPPLATVPVPAALQALGLQAAQLAIVGIILAAGAIAATGRTAPNALTAPRSCQESARTAPALDTILCAGSAYLTLLALYRQVAP